MAIHVALSHSTRYRYDRLVSLSPHTVRLRPAPHCRTPVVSYSLKVDPRTQFLNWQQDPHGNYLARVVFPEKTRELTVNVDLVVELSVINPFDFFLAASAPDGGVPVRSEPAALAGDPLPDPPRAGRADARGDALARKRLLPRHGMAARAGAPSSRTGGAVRLRLPDSARARRQIARRSDRRRGRLHRPACVGGGVSAGRGVGWT